MFSKGAPIALLISNFRFHFPEDIKDFFVRKSLLSQRTSKFSDEITFFRPNRIRWNQVHCQESFISVPQHTGVTSSLQLCLTRPCLLLWHLTSMTGTQKPHFHTTWRPPSFSLSLSSLFIVLFLVIAYVFPFHTSTPRHPSNYRNQLRWITKLPLPTRKPSVRI